MNHNLPPPEMPFPTFQLFISAFHFSFSFFFFILFQFPDIQGFAESLQQKLSQTISTVVSRTMGSTDHTNHTSDGSWCLYIVCTFFWNQTFISQNTHFQVYFNTDRLLIEFNGLWYSLAARQVWVKDGQRQKHTSSKPHPYDSRYPTLLALAS